MSEDSSISTEVYKPRHVIVCYSDGKDSYLELHDYQTAYGKIQMGAGKPLTRSALKKMLSLVTSHDKSIQATIKNMLPQNILYIDQRIGKHIIIWYQPATAQQMHFKSMSIKSGTSKVPAMIYAVSDDKLYVYALNSGRRPDFKTKLFHAPFFNVYEDGSVCMGNVKKPEGIVDIASAMDAWEKAFWCSEFTQHVWGRAYKSLPSFWRKRLKAKRKTSFPNKMLVAQNKIKHFRTLCEKI